MWAPPPRRFRRFLFLEVIRFWLSDRLPRPAADEISAFWRENIRFFPDASACHISF